MLSRLDHRVVIIDPFGLAAVFGTAIGADLRVLRRHPGSPEPREEQPGDAGAAIVTRARRNTMRPAGC
jgi:hypothetical protein